MIPRYTNNKGVEDGGREWTARIIQGEWKQGMTHEEIYMDIDLLQTSYLTIYPEHLKAYLPTYLPTLHHHDV
jgi:hypothetical protein